MFNTSMEETMSSGTENRSVLRTMTNAMLEQALADLIQVQASRARRQLAEEVRGEKQLERLLVSLAIAAILLIAWF